MPTSRRNRRRQTVRKNFLRLVDGILEAQDCSYKELASRMETAPQHIHRMLNGQFGIGIIPMSDILHVLGYELCFVAKPTQLVRQKTQRKEKNE